MTRRAVLPVVLAALALPAGAQAGTPGEDAHRAARSIALDGPRPAASAGERRAQLAVLRRFRATGLRTAVERFAVPGRGTSRNVIGIKDTPRRCLHVVMAHADTVPGTAGADDNASGVGALVALAPRLLEDGPCDVWLVATGAEERGFTGRPDHLGSLALVRRVARLGRARDLRWALSLDEVGRGRSFWLRSPVPRVRSSVEGRVLSAARAADVAVRWVRDEGTGNSDHREFELAGLRAMKLGVPDDPVRHTPADRPSRLQRGAFDRVMRVLLRVVTGRVVR